MKIGSYFGSCTLHAFLCRLDVLRDGVFRLCAAIRDSVLRLVGKLPEIFLAANPSSAHSQVNRLRWQASMMHPPRDRSAVRQMTRMRRTNVIVAGSLLSVNQMKLAS
ncbi:MAG: hypothetical protein CMJ64_04455 [Planctomycetaceae bacterium]|nr:hypothetical protein [Planctomycetaceae bacterium]